MSKHDNRKKGNKSPSFLPLGFICKDMKSVSVCVPSTTAAMIDKSSFRKNNSNLSSTGSLSTIPSSSISSSETVLETERPESSGSMTSFTSLLCELNELERSVKELGRNKKYPSPSIPSFSTSDNSNERTGASERLEESFVVVKESDNPLEDFKKSLLQMIVENEIVSKDEMEELLQKFLLLNSIENHDVIVRAFTELWEEVLSEVDVETPKLVPSRGTGCSFRHSRQVH